MRNGIAALAAALALACPAFATVTGNPPPTAYTCNGSTTTYAIPWPYITTSHVLATVKTGTSVTTLTIGTDYTVSPSVAPSVGTLTLTAGSKCPNASTLTLTRNISLTQPQSFRTGPYSGAAVEQAQDRAIMEIQGVAATHATDKAAQAAKDATQDAAISQGSVGGNSTLVTATGTTNGRPLSSWFTDVISVRAFPVVGDGTTSDTAAVQAACAATAGRRLYFPAGTYRITADTTCGSGTIWFESGALISVDVGVTFTASGRVVSLGGDPKTGAGTIVYSNDINLFANNFGFAVGKVSSNNTDDFIHFERDTNTNSGILVKNLDPGALVDAFIHLWGGPISGGTQGSDLRMSATSQAGGRLVNLVAGNAAAFSIISASTLGTVDTYAGNVRQFSVEPVTTAVNYLATKGSAAGSGPSIYPRGTDTNINMTIGSQGTGSVLFRTDLTGTPRFQFEVHDVVGSTAWIQARGSAGGSPSLTTSSLAPINIQVPITYTPVTFANLGTPANFTVIGCSDCTIANPCAGGGTGAIAKRLAGVWVCN